MHTAFGLSLPHLLPMECKMIYAGSLTVKHSQQGSPRENRELIARYEEACEERNQMDQQSGE